MLFKSIHISYSVQIFFTRVKSLDSSGSIILSTYLCFWHYLLQKQPKKKKQKTNKKNPTRNEQKTDF